MKIRSLLLCAVAVAASVFAIATVHADEKKIAGPNGGRVLTRGEPHAEFFVTKDRKIQITFLDKANRPVPPTDQSVTVVAGDRSAPQTFTFVKSGASLISNAPLPAGNNIPAVVMIKSSPNAKAVMERLNLNLSHCGGCDLLEYACTCGH